jgi:hypothetical protein
MAEQRATDDPRRERSMASKSSDKVSQSGKGSDAARLSQSPLSIRRGGADPTDIDDTPLNLDFGERNYDENTLQPKGPIEATGAGEK